MDHMILLGLDIKMMPVTDDLLLPDPFKRNMFDLMA